MAGSPSLWVLEQPADNRERAEWLQQRADRLADRIADQINGVVSDSIERFIQSLEGSYLVATGDYAVFDPIRQVWVTTTNETIAPALVEHYGLGAQGTAVNAANHAVINQSFAVDLELTMPRQADAYVAQRTNLISGASDTLFNDVVSRVDNAVRTGASVDELSRDLRALTKYGKYRADVIAHTELLTSYSVGQWETIQLLAEFGPKEKSWEATRDPETRDTHNEMSRRPIPINQPFEVGEASLMYPREPGGLAQEVINCRCTMLEWYSGDRRPDGTIVP
jgi:hypothetical protein